jgi:hypothetical protein
MTRLQLVQTSTLDRREPTAGSVREGQENRRLGAILTASC